MKLKLKNQLSMDWKEYICDLTKELDEYFKDTNPFKHYILVTTEYSQMKCYPIRSSEGTLGGLFVDEDNVITKINISLEHKSLKLNSIVQSFIGQKIVI